MCVQTHTALAALAYTCLHPGAYVPVVAFSAGACWAGTIVWQAALDLSDYLSRHHAGQLAGGATVVELGCGIGVPGMVAHLLGASAVLTEQAELLGLLRRNLAANFGVAHASASQVSSRRRTAPFISAAQLDWATDDPRALLRDHFEGAHPDFILSADCIYEPLYGESWKALVTALRGLCGPHTRALVCVERRTADGINGFLDAARGAGLEVTLPHASGASGVPIELYEMRQPPRHGGSDR
ncbi:putative methyltransferase-domain-containing protein [Tribonema minus]|uniref:Putative methyltransferase-domain-containing protein n=1 Tax=Tribonema minus TaxID=303371 RepID=A0A836CJX9_9STRA|nr:putative methyltransferase-domain-containing protein [Tribonema minus]